MRMNIQFKIIVWIANTIITCHSLCSHTYGAEPCTKYIPALPGKTPPCAQPGYTYCEHPDRYPGQLINFLVKKWKYDHTTLFSSESKEDYSSYFYPPVNPVYGPPNYRPPTYDHQQMIPQQPIPPHAGAQQQNGYPEPIYIPKPQYPFQDEGYNYPPPNYYQPQNFTGYSDPGNTKYSNPYVGQPNRPWYQPYQQVLEQPQYGQYNNLWKRSVHQNNRRYKRSQKFKRMPRIYSGKFENSTSLNRSKRQTAPGQRTLCPIRTQYIIPRAALNNKGNWMYVVNMPEVDSRVTQLVKSEICNSQTCDGICSLPDGYTSKCEQKYVQKRLVALESEGNQLYTDVFWFPSCCLCTLTLNTNT
ncbi:unnamed protein product [Psylliodes chrysocephalus]|uniref:Spaetzle domain-containing protein n=1 Tax=Psylliodes chrysocephalus TaxID=3402493 RepID=A0A9P0GH14_9CUCU|nr:unnamed protein product [Psylliodes chrysocephala]